MKVLITGGSGLIGSKITELLLKKNITVVHLTRHLNSRSGVKTYEWNWEKGIIDLNIRFDTPVVFCVLTDNNMQQSIDRSGGKYGNKGVEAAITALKLANIN